MALNYPRLDNASGIWTMKEVEEAVKGGYWPVSGARAVFAGGQTPSFSNVIDYVTISVTGDAADFGDLSVARSLMGNQASSFTRGIWAGGAKFESPEQVNTIEYITIMTTGNVTDFGDLSATVYGSSCFSNSVRALLGGGVVDKINIDYWSMASLGNAADFGDLSVARYYTASTSSPTRGVWAGGFQPPNMQNVIDYVTIATTGNGADFGDLTSARISFSGCSSSTRGVFCGGTTPSYIDVMEFITIPSTGNAVDYGDLIVAKKEPGVTSNSIRAVAAGGETPSFVNTIEYFSIPTGGTVTDFGDTTVARVSSGPISNAHGGLNDGNQGVVDTT